MFQTMVCSCKLQIIIVLIVKLGNEPHKINYFITTSEMSTIAHSYMENEGAWIIPRQNKMNIQCKLDGEITTTKSK